MILSDHATTGDGTLAALQLLAEMVISEKAASELLHQFDPVPQLLNNVRFAGGKPLLAAAVHAEIAEREAMLAGPGRPVIRASGPDPAIRGLAEGAHGIASRRERGCQSVRISTDAVYV